MNRSEELIQKNYVQPGIGLKATLLAILKN